MKNWKTPQLETGKKNGFSRDPKGADNMVGGK
jgi:hypothetical protein